MNKDLTTYILPILNHKEVENINLPIIVRDWISKKNTWTHGTHGFISESHKTFKEEQMLYHNYIFLKV
jgi:hypothetical protein